MSKKYMVDISKVNESSSFCVTHAPPFAVIDHGYGHDCCLHVYPGIVYAALHIRNHMGNPG